MATKTAKKATTVTKITKKVEVKTSLDKMQKTAKKVNVEIQETASFVAKDLKANSEEIKDIAVKAIKKMNMTESVGKIKSTAKKINTEIVNTTVEVADSIIKEGKKVTTNVTEKATKAIKNIDIAQGFEKAQTTAKNINDFSLKSANELLDATQENSHQWQQVAEKAVKGGLKLADKQQEMVFDTLETVKKQFVKNSSRLVDIFTK